VFVGPNNSGKSSILEVLRLVRDACGQYPFDSRGGFKEVVFRHDQNRNVEITLEISPSSSERRELLEDLFAHNTVLPPETVEASRFLSRLTYSFSYNSQYLISESLACNDFDDSDIVLISRKAEDSQWSGKHVALESACIGLSTKRMGQLELKKADQRAPPPREILAVGFWPAPKEYAVMELIRQYVSQWRWLGPFRRSSVSQPPTEQVELSPDGSNLPAILNTISSNYPDLFDEIENEVHKIVSDVTKMLAPLRGGSTTVLTKEDKTLVSFDPLSMSFGIQQTIILVTQFLNSRALLILEEPENHLHARSQRRFLDLLRRRILKHGIQIFMTTHSCILTGCANDIQTYLVKKQGGVTSVFPIEEPSELRLVKAELGHKNIDLYSYECALFVEGDTEELALPIIANSMGYDLVEIGIRILNVRGKGKASKIEEYLRYLKDSDVIPFIIADSDKQVAQKVDDWIKAGLLPQGNYAIWPLEFEDCFGDERIVRATKEMAHEHDFESSLDADELKKRLMEGKPVAKVLSRFLYEKGLPELDKPEFGERLALIVREEIEKRVERKETEPERVIEKIVNLAKKS